MSTRPQRHHHHQPALSKTLISLQDQYNNNIMDIRTGQRNPGPQRKVPERRMDYSRSFTQGHGKVMFRYFTLESLLLLVCLTVSLLILPLILPPLPPPPFMLLLLPIGMLVVLMLLAFMPSNIREPTYAAYT